jgi:anthraniloyl-CoA monooxygenase
MKIVSVGGGPAALYSSILFKKAFPQAEITVFERNRLDDTFGWGVVFSRETLGNLKAADAESYALIEAQFAYWDDIETYYRGECVTSTGHGFCGLSRRALLGILQARAVELGVTLVEQKEIRSLTDLPKADLVLAADGVHSLLRQELTEQVKPTVDWRKAKFCWLGTTKPLRAFTFVFKQTPHGVFQVHAYPFEAQASTWIVECHEDVWRRAGLENASEADTVAFCEKLFAEELAGHKLLTNKSIWRSFPNVKLERWHFGNVVFLGDAAHTAHFSIGSGTKLALEDAIALVDAFKAKEGQGVLAALAAYQESRRVDVIKLQKAAQTSLEWFENSSRYFTQAPLQFAFNLMTRSKRITYDNLRDRDPALVKKVDAWFAKENGSTPRSDGSAPPPLFAPMKLRGLKLENRIVVSPMCQYSAVDGLPNEWHLVHLGSRAVGGAGLVFTEMTDVSAEGRITPGCTGMYRKEHTDAWKRIVDFVHTHSRARMGIQLAHAGRKGSCSRPWEGDRPLERGGWQTVGPTALPFKPDWPAPRELSVADLARVRSDFVRAVGAADQAGFDIVELHAAHGYLLSSFLSPLSNQRTDGYGGSLENRARLLLEIFEAVRPIWPTHKPISVRLSATDWLEPEGMTLNDAVKVSRWLKERGCDLIDVSSAGNVPESSPEYGRMYQVPFAERIRAEAGIAVMAVGAITGADHANTVIAAGRADLCALARPHLDDPYLTLHAAKTYGYDAQAWPSQYLTVRPRLPDAPEPKE